MFFKRFLLTIAVSAFLLNAETDFRFAFPQSEILLGVDVKWLLKSPFGASMKKELKGNLGDLKALEPLMDQIDSIHLSTSLVGNVVAAVDNGNLCPTTNPDHRRVRAEIHARHQRAQD